MSIRLFCYRLKKLLQICCLKIAQIWYLIGLEVRSHTQVSLDYDQGFAKAPLFGGGWRGKFIFLPFSAVRSHIPGFLDSFFQLQSQQPCNFLTFLQWSQLSLTLCCLPSSTFKSPWDCTGPTTIIQDSLCNRVSWLAIVIPSALQFPFTLYFQFPSFKMWTSWRSREGVSFAFHICRHTSKFYLVEVELTFPATHSFL